jgi:predicted site-specific integrase-resolvase
MSKYFKRYSVPPNTIQPLLLRKAQKAKITERVSERKKRKDFERDVKFKDEGKR